MNDSFETIKLIKFYIFIDINLMSNLNTLVVLCMNIRIKYE